ncbi:hypothetical protein R3P38DRAFT_2757311 [Favolaschia claudopus]|uniref:Uncharacterized protein n=1 Tax=Favolaschia claudopus TaxID=2862362 RepID=A0AAW0EK85_9AGAR
MFMDNEAYESFLSPTADEIGWLNASQAFGDDADSDLSFPPPELVKSHSIAVPKTSRSRIDTRRRSILLDDFFGSSRSVDSGRFKFGYSVVNVDGSTTSDTTPSSIVFGRPFERRSHDFSRHSSRTATSNRVVISASEIAFDYIPIAQQPLKLSLVHIPHLLRFPILDPHSDSIVSSQRSPRTGSARTRTPSRSSPNLLEFTPPPRPPKLASPPQLFPIQRERSGSQSSSASTTSSSSLPRTPPSPSLYSQHSFNHPRPDTRCTTPTKSILTLSPKRSPSISTKHSSGSKSVTFNEVPAIRYTGDRVDMGDGMVRGEEWNSKAFDGGVHCMGFDLDGMDPVDERGTPTPTPTEKYSGSLKRLLTRRRTKHKSRPEISGPYALSASHSSGSSTQPSQAAESQYSFRSPTPLSARSKSSTFIVQEVGVIPSSPNGGHDMGPEFPLRKPIKSTSLIGPGDPGVLADHGRFLSPKFHSHPARSKSSHKAASISGSKSSAGLHTAEPVLHALPSMESFRSERSRKSSQSYGRFKHWLGRIGIGVTA